VAYVYLLHFDAPLEHTQHYTGSCDDLARRLDEHSHGRAAQLTRRFAAAGVAFVVGAVWEYPTRLDARRAERRVKVAGSARRCCICRARRAGSEASNRAT
jgi:predicted GIY-YIG superfamily endonuclease